jgi:hypothetical protein
MLLYEESKGAPGVEQVHLARRIHSHVRVTGIAVLSRAGRLDEPDPRKEWNLALSNLASIPATARPTDLRGKRCLDRRRGGLPEKRSSPCGN